MVRNLPLLLLFIYAAAPCSGVNSNGCSSLERYKDCQEIRYTTAQHHVILMRIVTHQARRRVYMNNRNEKMARLACHRHVRGMSFQIVFESD